MDKLAQWWLTPKFPKKHIENIRAYRPHGLRTNFRNFYRTWILHPIKRRVAKYYLVFLRRVFGLKVIGITGSAGKTTTKEILASILKKEGSTIFTYASIDPVYNIPTTILKCTPTTKFLILEMSIEFPGEMDFYLWMAKPDVSIMTNIYPTHILFLESVENIAKEKGKIVTSLSSNDTAVLNFEDRQIKLLSKKIRAKILWFGKGSNIEASNVEHDNELRTKFTLQINKDKFIVRIPALGQQYVQNSLSAIGAALAFNISIDTIKTGLENFNAPDHRMIPILLKNGAVLIDDVYNNNPEAAKKSISILKGLDRQRRKVLVFGDMKELGHMETKFHKEIGTFAANHGIDFLVGYGTPAKFTVEAAIQGGISKNKTFYTSSKDELLDILRELIKPNDIVLIKSSRSLFLEEIVDKLKVTNFK